MPHHQSFVIACGGTGGHVFPGLATARELQTRGHTVTLCLAGQALETAAAPDWTGDTLLLDVRPVPLRHPAAAGRGLASLARATVKLVRRWRRSRPAALLAMGSYTSLAPVLAARMLRIPIVLHEANAVPGRAIGLLSRLAHRTCLSFEAARDCLPNRATIVTGLPVRRDIAGQTPFEGFADRGFGLLIMGGSQGAQRLNQVGVAAVEQLLIGGMDDLAVIHLTGSRDADRVRERYRQAGLRRVMVAPFLREIGRAYASVDLAVCRAGAASCAELCLCGLPALLVPLPSAVRDHQSANARVLAAQGAALCIAESALDAEGLAARIRDLRAASAFLAALRLAAAALARPDADRHLADIVEQAGNLGG